MTAQPKRPSGQPVAPASWYSRSPQEVATALGVEPAVAPFPPRPGEPPTAVPAPETGSGAAPRCGARTRSGAARAHEKRIHG